MKTRRNRRNRRGGAGEDDEVKQDEVKQGQVKQGENNGFLASIGNVLGLNKDTKPETQQSIPEAQGQPIQEASPIDPNAQIKDAQAVPVDVDAQIKADAQAAEAGPVLGVTARTGNANIDDEVTKLTKEEGYYFRAMINAIGVCNSTMKLKYNVLNPLNSEMFICGEECHKRADIIRKTIERFIPYLQQSDALGYIGSERVLSNSGAYLFNSAASLGSKAASLGKTGYDSAVYAYQDPRAAVENVGSAVGKAAYNAPTAMGKAAYTGLTNVGKSAIAVGNYFTRKAPVQTTQGGRRTRRRR